MAKRLVEVFSAGCALCQEAVQLVKGMVCESCELQVHDMRTPGAQAKAKRYGVTRVPAVVVNGELVSCCSVGPVDAATLKGRGVGVRA